MRRGSCTLEGHAHRRDQIVGMRKYQKQNFPLAKIRRFSNPVPSCSPLHGDDERNIMTLGWHMMLGFGRAGRALHLGPEPQLLPDPNERGVRINLPDVRPGRRRGQDREQPRARGDAEAFGLTPRRHPRSALIGGVLRELRVSAGRREPDRPARPVRVRECVQAHVAASPCYLTTGPLPRRWGVHGLGRNAS